MCALKDCQKFICALLCTLPVFLSEVDHTPVLSETLLQVTQDLWQDHNTSLRTLITAALMTFQSAAEKLQPAGWKVHGSVAFTFWQTLLILCRRSRVSCGFCRYWGSSACRTRMENGTIEPTTSKINTTILFFLVITVFFVKTTQKK